MTRFEHYDKFVNRHIGISDNERSEMLKEIGVSSIEELIDKTIPASIKLKEELNIGEPFSEKDSLEYLKMLSEKNKIYKSYIGLGYYGTVTPSVIKRNILENPGWYTSYTPYQAEISQGRLEALLNYQTMLQDLTGLPLANSSLLDEATAAAEAMLMFHAMRRGTKKAADKFLVSSDSFPQTIDVIKTRAKSRKIKVEIVDFKSTVLTDDCFGIFVQYPTCSGNIINYKPLFHDAAEKGIFISVAADLMSLTLLTPPGELGADAVLGSVQRFGLPMGFGGPHAGYFVTREEYKRKLPGRIIGVSKDRNGKHALRMALQMREQHIKREKATSNICTAQVLLAVLAGMYAVYHGPEGLKAIAERIYNLSHLLNDGLSSLGYKQENEFFFDTLKISFPNPDEKELLNCNIQARGINLNYYSDKSSVGISIDETTSESDIEILLDLFADAAGKNYSRSDFAELIKHSDYSIPCEIRRTTKFMTHPVFHKYHTETEMMRYMKRLENKDISLVHSMISLGSCTMKLNAATEMYGIGFPGFSDLHPFAPPEQTEGYQQLFEEFNDFLCKITGFSKFSIQPNSGAQGEYTGLMAIRQYHISNGDTQRNIVLIPSSAHGTNPASAVMAGGKVVVIKCDELGNVDIEDLKTKAEENKDNLSALMVTYPSTHGVFEEGIKDICNIIHKNGGLVYMDGANMNAQVGLTSPKEIGADVCHLNLHKTFAIPHGGGGPGVGPVGVTKELAEYLPNHAIVTIGSEKSFGSVSAAPFGSASVIPISFAYIQMLGSDGLKISTQTAILNANYIKAKLTPYYRVVYSGSNGFVGHELIFDLHEFKNSAGVTEGDLGKRLMDYGYHAPTVSFPVHATFMIEPTESESKEELDKFIDAMISIRNEIDEIAEGKYSREDNVIVNAPHTAEELAGEWEHSYSREKAVFPNEHTKINKFWPAVSRVDNALGDRNLICSCPPIEDYLESE